MATRLELWDFGSRVGEGKEGVGDAAGLLFSVWAWRERMGGTICFLCHVLWW
jgi:hypothetical protein